MNWCIILVCKYDGECMKERIYESINWYSSGCKHDGEDMKELMYVTMKWYKNMYEVECKRDGGCMKEKIYLSVNILP